MLKLKCKNVWNRRQHSYASTPSPLTWSSSSSWWSWYRCEQLPLRRSCHYRRGQTSRIGLAFRILSSVPRPGTRQQHLLIHPPRGGLGKSQAHLPQTRSRHNPSWLHRRRTSLEDWCGAGNKTSNGAHTLPRGSMCMMTSTVSVSGGTSLILASVERQQGPGASMAPRAIISGEGTNMKMFFVEGNLTLVDLVVERGTNSNGGCLYVQSNGEADARAQMVNSLLHSCVATGWGGAGYVRGARASLVLEGSVAEGNSAKYGGAFFIDEGASLSVVASSGNATSRLGSNTATMAGGGVASERGAKVLVERGAALVIQSNTATSQYGGACIFTANSTLTATGKGTRIMIDSNTAAQYGAG